MSSRHSLHYCEPEATALDARDIRSLEADEGLEEAQPIDGCDRRPSIGHLDHHQRPTLLQPEPERPGSQGVFQHVADQVRQGPSQELSIPWNRCDSRVLPDFQLIAAQISQGTVAVQDNSHHARQVDRRRVRSVGGQFIGSDQVAKPGENPGQMRDRPRLASHGIQQIRGLGRSLLSEAVQGHSDGQERGPQFVEEQLWGWQLRRHVLSRPGRTHPQRSLRALLGACPGRETPPIGSEHLDYLLQYLIQPTFEVVVVDGGPRPGSNGSQARFWASRTHLFLLPLRPSPADARSACQVLQVLENEFGAGPDRCRGVVTLAPGESIRRWHRQPALEGLGLWSRPWVQRSAALAEARHLPLAQIDHKVADATANPAADLWAVAGGGGLSG